MTKIIIFTFFAFLKPPTDSSSTNFQIHFSDTINVKNIPYRNNNESKKNENAPWIVALIIGLISAGANIYISRIQTKKQESVYNRSIIENRKLAIETLTKNQFFEGNQNWKNMFRIKLSSFISSGNKLAIKLRGDNEKPDIIDKLFIEFEFSKIELKLLLDNNLPVQEELENSINEFYTSVIQNSEKDNLSYTLRKGEDISTQAIEILNT